MVVLTLCSLTLASGFGHFLGPSLMPSYPPGRCFSRLGIPSDAWAGSSILGHGDLPPGGCPDGEQEWNQKVWGEIGNHPSFSTVAG